MNDKNAKLIRIGNKVYNACENTADTAIFMGQELLKVKHRLPYGQFETWMRSECSISRKTSYQYIQIAQRFGNSLGSLKDLPLASLYALAAPSTPDAVIEMVRSGQVLPTVEAIREAKERQKSA